MLHFDPEEFREKFDRHHFQLTHELAGRPQFSLPRLVGLAKSIAETRPKDVYCDIGDVEIGQRWEAIPKATLPIDEIIHRIETQGAWIVLWRVEQDAAYSDLLDQAMQDILRMTGPELERDIKKKEVILFITSPNRVTTYHIDRECNFLLQIQGKKEISVFARDDRDVLPEEEIERFWTVDNNAPIYRADLQKRANVIHLEPGGGVHIPVNAPHWLRNGANISVTASFNFQFRDGHRANLYRANYYLRKLGVRPRPPFISPAADVLRRRFGAAAYKARQIYRGAGLHD